MTDPVKVEVVGPVMTNTENPWRTQGDYREDQRRQIQLHTFQAITLVVAVAGLLASSWFQYQASQQPPQKVEVQCISPLPQVPNVSGAGKSQTPSNISKPSKPSLQP